MDRLDARTVRRFARAVGFDDAGIAPVAVPEEGARLRQWLEAGHAASMQWLGRNTEIRLDLRERFPWARSVVMVARSYRDPGAPPTGGGLARFVSSYARGADYHDVLLPRLEALAARLREVVGELRHHAYVDTGPVLERQLAAAAGLGWTANNTLLLHPRHGSRFFLGTLVTDLDLAPTPEPLGSCGNCQACQPACPTGAFVEPGVLDARRCISYLTIEHRGPIDRALRPAMGQWLFGCDLCQTCCPFEVAAHGQSEAAFAAGEALTGIGLAELLGLDEEGFRARFRRTPLWRPRREGLLRNALIVAANGEHHDCLPPALALLDDPSPVLRDAASWCVARLGGAAEVETLRRVLESEAEEWVRTGLAEDLARLRAATGAVDTGRARH